MVRVTAKDAQAMKDAYAKMYAPKEEPKVEAEPPKEEPVNPKPLDFETMSKLELETFGRTIGIELDRRHNKTKLIKQLQDHIEYMETM